MKKLLITLALTCASLQAFADPLYRAQYIDVGNSGGIDLNNLGVMITTNNGGTQAFLAGGGVYAALGTLGGRFTYAVELNDRNAVVGESQVAGGASHAFVYANGAMRDLGTLGGVNSRASGINNAGMVSGWSDLADGSTRAFAYTADGGMRDLGTLGGASSKAYDVSETGEVLGTAQTATGEWHTFLYQNGVMTDVDAKYGPDLYGFGPNGELFGTSHYTDRDGWTRYSPNLKRSSWRPGYGPDSLGGITDMADGYIVGINSNPVSLEPVLATREGTYRLVDLVPGATYFGEVSAVNDHGQILAWGGVTDSAGNARYGTFLLTPVNPVPEPATAGMLALGLGLLATARRRVTRRNN